MFILVNGEYKGELPKPTEICGYKLFYRVIDVNYFYQISEQSRIPIEIDFEENGYRVPCLEADINNSDYQAYIAVMPGACLADLYERFGTRLLEQNVRSFLQFSGKINKGMRTTIQKEPHMFLAFNNGISATADSIVLDENKDLLEESFDKFYNTTDEPLFKLRMFLRKNAFSGIHFVVPFPFEK